MNCNIRCAELPSRATPWTYLCTSCQHWQSDLAIRLQSDRIHEGETSDGRDDDIDFLWPVRQKNFRVVLEAL